MKPIKFEEQTMILQKPKGMTDEECGTLPVYTDGKNCVSCWKMSWKERIKAILFGRIWLYVWSGKTQPPVSLLCDKTVFKKEMNDGLYK